MKLGDRRVLLSEKEAAMDYKKKFYDAVDRPGHWCWLTSVKDAGGETASVTVHTRDEDEHCSELPEEELKSALAWIKQNLVPRETPLEGYSSYSIKHIMEHSIGLYVTNQQFKELMLLCGFYPVKVDEKNWRYCLSMKSPAFQTGLDKIASSKDMAREIPCTHDIPVPTGDELFKTDL